MTLNGVTAPTDNSDRHFHRPYRIIVGMSHCVREILAKKHTQQKQQQNCVIKLNKY